MSARLAAIGLRLGDFDVLVDWLTATPWRSRHLWLDTAWPSSGHLGNQRVDETGLRFSRL